MNNLIKRIGTSFFLIFILSTGLFINEYLFLILLIVSSYISFYEFNNLIKKNFKKKREIVLNFQIFCILFFVLFIYTSYEIYIQSPIFLIWIILICIFSDTGGFIIGKLIGGKKLTKISPNKTIAGCVGSFIFSLFSLIFILYIKEFRFHDDINFINLVLITLLLSSICQLGDLFVSYFKRKAKVKDTGDILPGHGGLLDRIDGLIFVLPSAFIVDKIFF